MKRGDRYEYTDAYGRIVECQVERVVTGRVYVRLDRSGGIVWFDRGEIDRLRQRAKAAG